MEEKRGPLASSLVEDAIANKEEVDEFKEAKQKEIDKITNPEEKFKNIKKVGNASFPGEKTETNSDRDSFNGENDSNKQFNEDTDKKKTQKKLVMWFSELNKDSGNIAGGKGANLAEMYNNKIPVPPGFVITAQAYDYFIEKAGIKEQIKELLGRIDYEETTKLDEITRQIRTFIVESEMPYDLQEEIIDSYENLDVPKGNFEKGNPLHVLNKSSEPLFVAIRSSATTEDLEGASFAGQQDTYLNIKGKTDLLKSIKKCFASLFTTRATYYRNKKGFPPGESSIAVVVQKMVDSDKSGVGFSKDPSGKDENIVLESVWGLGEGIVSGKITPDKHVLTPDLDIVDKKIAHKKIAITRNSAGEKQIVKLKEKADREVLTGYEVKRTADLIIKLEEHYQKPQDVEFAIEGDNIYITQTRPITTLKKQEVQEEIEIKGEILLFGLGASSGIGSGEVKIVRSKEDLDNVKKGDVLVTEMTDPDMVVTMQKCSAIVTNEGGLTAHAAIVSREMGIPCIVGTGEATEKLREGQLVTVDGTSGNVYEGKVAETQKKEIKPVTKETKTDIKVTVDLPGSSERASKTGVKKIGLTRIEGIIAESGKHPQYFKDNNKIQDYENVIYEGIKKIVTNFEEIWVRSSDIRSNEYSNLEGAPNLEEDNPMLGMHGIRYSLKHPEILKAELRALKRISQENKKVGILMPQVISVEELKEAKKYIKEIDFENLKIGIMIETPAAIQLIKEFAEEGIDFISFGTNDLTQYMLAVDRGNTQVQNLYDEMSPAILRQLQYVIRVCKRNNIESSICGQAGSKKEMVKFLVENNIDSLSVNPDMAAEIAEYVAELESNSQGEETQKEEKEENVEDKQIDEEDEEKQGEEEDNKDKNQEEGKEKQDNELGKEMNHESIETEEKNKKEELPPLESYNESLGNDSDDNENSFVKENSEEDLHEENNSEEEEIEDENEKDTSGPAGLKNRQENSEEDDFVDDLDIY